MSVRLVENGSALLGTARRTNSCIRERSLTRVPLVENGLAMLVIAASTSGYTRG